MRADLLHVVAVHSNPMRWRRRVELTEQFITHMLDSGVHLTLVECGLHDRPFDFHQRPGLHLIQVRTNSINWNKENLLNIGIARLPADWKYVAWIDGDIQFRHKQWASETVHALQQYPIIQPWSDCYDLGPNEEHLEHHKSFAALWWLRRIKGIGLGYEFAHPGYAWACRREALDKLGGLIETGVGGAGDHHMSLGLIGKAMWSIPSNMTPGYKMPIYQWQDRATGHLHKHIGRLHGSIEHFWHGRKKKRKYIERWEILSHNKFDPSTDLKRNVWGVIELAGNKPALTHDLDVYFRQREEDGNEM